MKKKTDQTQDINADAYTSLPMTSPPHHYIYTHRKHFRKCFTEIHDDSDIF